ncbi:hypothetical protein CEXT_340211 [Caerostris extrusa]|uniref:Uncharacterized protein n=1 Tax=Caerostris extrusa TaxID=172846 RepID=A0AAV4TXR2_CAEEX|nr:hypothetical protein CEXT_340211 [Caerostris extrusa]
MNRKRGMEKPPLEVGQPLRQVCRSTDGGLLLSYSWVVGEGKDVASTPSPTPQLPNDSLEHREKEKTLTISFSSIHILMSREKGEGRPPWKSDDHSDKSVVQQMEDFFLSCHVTQKIGTSIPLADRKSFL